MDSVVHFEIPADDVSRAKKFYEATFGWGMEDVPQMNYVMAKTGDVGADRMPKDRGVINGGMTKRSGTLPAPSFAINVRSIDEAVAKIKAAGGSMVKDKVPVGTMGFIAYFQDTEGNVLSVWENAA